MYNVKEHTPEDLYEEFVSLAEKEKLFDVVSDKTKLLEFLCYESNDGAKGFFHAPASTKYHGNYPGGLYEHSRQVYLRLKQLTENNGLVWGRPQSPFIIGIFHDICKHDQYLKVPGIQSDFPGVDVIQYNAGSHYEYDTNTLIKGHATKSLIILSQLITLTEEEMLCIRYHMGAYEKEEWQEFDAAIRKDQNVLYTHFADMLASKVDDV